MIKQHKVFAVLTCNDNSKRLPGKVFARFAGSNLFEHAIKKLQACGYIDAIVVDTPHPEKCDAHLSKVKPSPPLVYNVREKDLCGDTVPILDVLKGCKALEVLDDTDFVVWVDFTKPLTPPETINTVIEAAAGSGWDSVFTVKRLRGNLLGSAAVCTQLKPKEEERLLYWGAVRLRTYAALKTAQPKTWGEGKRHVNLPIIGDWEVDIDYPHDLVAARAMYDYLNGGGV